jgi:endonuclease YncB( thermonuclease family)
VTTSFRSLLSILLLAAAACVPAAAKNLNGVVTHVTDGDTLWVRPIGGGEPVQVRIDGIDAPEICQPFGKQARDALASRVMRRPVQVASRARDIYDRTVGRVTANGQDVGEWLVTGGYAWASRYRNRAVYADQEAQARQARRGLWAAPAVEPRTFRRRHGSCQTP